MVRIHKEGKKFLTVLLIVLVIINTSMFLTEQSLFILISTISVFTFLFFLQFFRDPKIKKTLGDNKIVSPANGKVVFIGEAEEGEYFKKRNFKFQFLCLHLMFI